MTEYAPTFREAWPIYSIVGSLGGISLAVPILSGESYWLAPLGLAILGLLVLVRWRLRVVVSDQRLESTGLFRTSSLAWSDIQRVAPRGDKGLWARQTSGPNTYVFYAANCAVAVNFRFFSLECLQDVYRHLPEKLQLEVSTPPERP